jgi:hypothetical protein
LLFVLLGAAVTSAASACSAASSAPSASSAAAGGGGTDDDGGSSAPVGMGSGDAGTRGSRDAGAATDSGAGANDAGANLPNDGWAGSGTDKNASVTTDRCTGPATSTGAPIQLGLGKSGDHILGDTATMLPDRSMVITYYFASGIGHWSSSGQALAGSSGQIDEAWPIGSTGTVLGIGTSTGSVTRASLTDGSAVTAFGTAGKVSITGVLAYEYDDARQVLTILTMTKANSDGTVEKGPAEVAILEVNAITGAQTSKGTYSLPAYQNEKLDFHAIVSEADGSYVAVMSEFMELSASTRWSAVRLVGSSPPSRNVMLDSATASYDGFVGRYKGSDGSFDVFLRDNDVVQRLHVDAAGVPGAAATVPAVANDGNHQVGIGGPDLVQLVYTGTSFDVTRFAPDGSTSKLSYPAPAGHSYKLTSVHPQGCGISIAGLWDTTQDPLWYTQVRTIE